MSGLLGDVYSYGDSLKRKLRGLLADPVGTIALGVTRFGEDQQAQNDLSRTAYPFSKIDPTPDPQAQQAARNKLAELMTNQAIGAATVWHGSPHKFDRFDSSKIGTGEGAQAYGHGLYLAEAPDTAMSYRASVSSNGTKFGLEDGPTHGIATLIAARGAKGEEMARRGYADLGDKLEPTIARAKQAIHENSTLYKVDLPDSAIAKMLDWDKPLSQQAHITDKLNENLVLYPYDAKNGRELYEAVAKNNHPMGGRNTTDASSLFREAGIPGIRYLDGGSRGTGAGTSNYVVFPGNEDLLTILERNGEPVNKLKGLLGN